MVMEEDYVPAFQRLVDVTATIKRDGSTPVLLTARANLELAINSYEAALRTAEELKALLNQMIAAVGSEPVVKLISKFSPFGSAMFGTYVFNPGFLQEFPTLVLMQLGWIIILSAVLYLIYRSAQKELTINGG